LSKDLERLNIKRITLHKELSMEEKNAQEKEFEKNQLIDKKSSKLSELADKERVLHEKDYKNEEIRKQLEV